MGMGMENSGSANRKSQWGFWLVLLAAFILVRLFVFTPVTVNGESMAPTLHHKDKLLVLKLAGIDRFDIIVFETENDELFVKRVIGLPGDQVEYINDTLYINGKAYEEPYLDAAKKRFKEEYGEEMDFTPDFSLEDLGYDKVPEDAFFVLGDNRIKSYDSRYGEIGFIPSEKVVGEASVLFWPLDRVQLID